MSNPEAIVRIVVPLVLLLTTVVVKVGIDLATWVSLRRRRHQNLITSLSLSLRSDPGPIRRRTPPASSGTNREVLCQSAVHNCRRTTGATHERSQVINISDSLKTNLHCIVLGYYGNRPPVGAEAKVSSSRFLPGVNSDLKKIQDYIRQDARKCLTTVTSTISNLHHACDKEDKATCKRKIEDLMKSIKLECHDTSNGVLIWYTGHGKKTTGDWPMKDDEYLTFDELYDIYKKNFKGRPMYVVTDCCFSGSWVVRCAQLLDQDGITCGYRAKQHNMIIKVFAACLPKEKGYDRYYTECGGAKLYTLKGEERKIICFAQHHWLGHQHTLGVDFTEAEHTFCMEDRAGLPEAIDCKPNWTDRVNKLIKEKSSKKYLV